MSYFGQNSTCGLTASDQCSIDRTELDIEVADGVAIERRSVLWLSAAAVASLVGITSRLGSQDAPRSAERVASGKLTFDQFLAELLPHARRVVDSQGQDDEAYLMTVAAAMSRLRDPGAPLRQAMRKFAKEHRRADERFPLAAVSLGLKPGRGFAHHDHLNYSGVIMGIEGEVRIRNFDFLEAAPSIDSKQTFRIRETRDDLILPGRFSTLGCNRENIHELVAGKEGARVLDVFTFFSKDATSRFLDVEDKPRDAEARIYDAAWRPKRR